MSAVDQRENSAVAFEESEDLEGRELEAPKAQEWWQTVADSTIFSEFFDSFLVARGKST